MSQAKFAIIAGVSRKTVTQWKSKGYLVLDADGCVDADASMRVLIDRGLGNFQGVTRTDDEDVSGVTPDTFDKETTHIDFEKDRVDAGIQDPEQRAGDLAAAAMNSEDFELLSYADAERMKENFLALQQRLSYETKIGRLVDRSEVEAHFATQWAAERNSWEVWPSTVCADMASKLGVDQVKVRVLLEEAVYAHLKTRVASASEAEADGA